MSGNITEINDILLTYEDGSLVKVVQGYESVWQFQFLDDNDQPIDLSTWVMSAKAEFYEGTVRSDGFSQLARMKDVPNKPITVTANPDQTTNTGQYTMVIPRDLYQGDIMLGASRVPVVILYETFEFDTERRVERSAISIRRGDTG